MKGIWIRREGCMWDAEVADLDFPEFSRRMNEFASEEGGFATPYIVTREINGVLCDIWYDENFLSYMPVPSAVMSSSPGSEVLMGMLFICGADDENCDSRSLTEEEIKAVLSTYKVPSIEECQPYGRLGLLMMGYKLIHY